MIDNEEWNSNTRDAETSVQQPGMVQLELPDCWVDEVSERLIAAKRDYDKKCEEKYHKAKEDKGIVEVIVETVGFFDFYHTDTIQLDLNLDVRFPTTYGRTYYQEAAFVFFGGYAPTIWELQLLMVVGISRQTQSPPLPLIAFITRTIPDLEKENGATMGKMEFFGLPDARGRI